MSNQSSPKKHNEGNEAIAEAVPRSGWGAF